jgi:ABC-type glycerol-3-phosphate transport system substrate-binding protein
MKKKILAGLLTVSACFALGSTSFAADTTISTPSSPQAETSQVITPYAFYEKDIYLKVGDFGSEYSGITWNVIYNDGSTNVGTDRFVVTPVEPGLTVVSAEMGNAVVFLFKFHVSY